MLLGMLNNNQYRYRSVVVAANQHFVASDRLLSLLGEMKQLHAESVSRLHCRPNYYYTPALHPCCYMAYANTAVRQPL